MQTRVQPSRRRGRSRRSARERGIPAAARRSRAAAQPRSCFPAFPGRGTGPGPEGARPECPGRIPGTAESPGAGCRCSGGRPPAAPGQSAPGCGWPGRAALAPDGPPRAGPGGPGESLLRGLGEGRRGVFYLEGETQAGEDLLCRVVEDVVPLAPGTRAPGSRWPAEKHTSRQRPVWVCSNLQRSQFCPWGHTWRNRSSSSVRPERGESGPKAPSVMA